MIPLTKNCKSNLAYFQCIVCKLCKHFVRFCYRLALCNAHHFRFPIGFRYLDFFDDAHTIFSIIHDKINSTKYLQSNHIGNQQIYHRSYWFK